MDDEHRYVLKCQIFLSGHLPIISLTKNRVQKSHSQAIEERKQKTIIKTALMAEYKSNTSEDKKTKGTKDQ